MAGMHRIVALREKRSWTQQALADAAGVSLRTIQRLEREELESSKETLLAVAGAFDVGLSELFESEWEALKRWGQQLRVKLTEVFNDLDECIAAMRHHREEQGVTNSWFYPDFGAQGEQYGWREEQTGRGFALSLEGFLALSEDRRRRFLAERREIGDRVRLGIDPWVDHCSRCGKSSYEIDDDNLRCDYCGLVYEGDWENELKRKNHQPDSNHGAGETVRG